MIRLIRWAFTVAIVQGGMLLVMEQFISGFSVDFAPGVALIAIIFTVAQLVSWPMNYLVSARVHPVLFPFLSLVLSGLVVFLISQWQVLTDVANLQVANLQTGIAITLGLSASYTMFGGFYALRDLDAYSWFVTSRLRKTYLTLTKNQEPGTLFIEIDGLSYPLLQKALADGWMPNLAKWLEDGSHVLNEWETDLSSQTSASQAGILLGSNEGIPAFRWYDKPAGRMMVSSSLNTARHLENRLSNGKGLLHDGASRWNVFSGDAPDSLVTFSTVGQRDRGGSRRYIALFNSPYMISRVVALYIGDVFRERFEAIRQRYTEVEPRIKRTWRYAFVRAATTTLMLEYAQFMLLADMYRGMAAVYCTIFAYDEVAHHSGIDRRDSMKVLKRIDTMLGIVHEESQDAARPYQLVILSDHGQSQGATFRQRNGKSLGELVSTLVDPTASVEVFDSLEEDESYIRVAARHALTERNDDRTSRLIRLAANYRPGRKTDYEEGTPATDVMVLASGNLATIAFPKHHYRLTYEEIVEQFPMLLPGLFANPDIGFVMVRSATEGAIALNNEGIYYLDSDDVVGRDPLAEYGQRAADHLRRTDQFANAPDILVMSDVYSETGEVYAFEELVGSHGGLGGNQARPFVMHPTTLPYPSTPVVGAAALHDVLAGWLGESDSTRQSPTNEQKSLANARSGEHPSLAVKQAASTANRRHPSPELLERRGR